MIWSIDAQLDEILGDAKAVLASTSDQSANASAHFSEAKRVKQDVEQDKEKIQVIVKKFLVRII